MLCVVERGRLTSECGLVERGVVECKRDRSDRIGVCLREQSDQGDRIDPARKEGSDRNVGDRMSPGRVDEGFAQSFGSFRPVHFFFATEFRFERPIGVRTV